MFISAHGYLECVCVVHMYTCLPVSRFSSTCMSGGRSSEILLLSLPIASTLLRENFFCFVLYLFVLRQAVLAVLQLTM